MGCTQSSETKDSSLQTHQAMKFINSKLKQQEIQLLYLIFNDLASRIPEKKVNIQNFLLFFHKTGEWGDRLFKEFDADKSRLICIEEFVKGIAKIFKNDEKSKIRLLFRFFSTSADKSQGLSFNDLLTMLYNYPKDGLKQILNDGQFVDHQIRKRLIDIKQNRRLESIYAGGLNRKDSNSNEVQQCLLQESDTGSDRMQSAYGFKKVLEQMKKPKKDKEATSLKINVQGKSIEVKTNNIHHLVKKFARNIFKEYDLNPERGRLSADCFEKWIIRHKELYNNYYDGFHNEIWEFDAHKHCPKYLLNQCQKQSAARGHIDGTLISVYIYLYHGTIIVTRELEHDLPLSVIILDGLAVKKLFNKTDGFGIQIFHRDDFYHRKRFFFKNQKIALEWMELLKFYRGVSIQQQYEIGKKIGTGKFSVVYDAKQNCSGKQFAIKIIESTKLDQQAKQLIAHESGVMAVLNHPFLVSYKQSIQTKTHLYIVTQLVKGKDLFEFIKINQVLNQFQAAHYVRELLVGVKYIHSMGIVHRDLKPQNLMIVDDIDQKQYNLKIIDFGFSNYLTRLRQYKPEDLLAGTPGYIAPEILRNQPIDFKVDNFAIGAIIFFMLSGSIPFNGFSIDEMFKKTIRGQYSYEDKIWLRVSNEAKNLIDRLLDLHPQQRITLDQALSHPWFKVTNANQKVN